MNTAITQELVTLLQESTRLGLTFDIGSAYISRAYIDHQTDLRTRIFDAIARAEAAATFTKA
jgi:hypothetical protein